jgi:thiamine-phosphate pyrophosphorylase
VEVVRRRGALLAVAGDAVLARDLGAELVHNPKGPALGRPFSRSVHDEAEAEAAAREGAALVFVSPVYPTRSHPLATALGERRAARLAALAGVPAVALGGVKAAAWPRLRDLGFAGWAGIDAWLKP